MVHRGKEKNFFQSGELFFFGGVKTAHWKSPAILSYPSIGPRRGAKDLFKGGKLRMAPNNGRSLFKESRPPTLQVLSDFCPEPFLPWAP